MFFRWDWLRPVLTAPIVPTLGPVHPDALTVDVFEDVMRAAVTGDFLPYDKDRRWGGEKNETVLRGYVVHQPEQTLVPTLTRRGRGTVKVFAYGHHRRVVDEAAELAAKLAAAHDAANARVVRPLGPETAHPRGTRIQLKDFTTGPCPAPDGPVRPLPDWPAAVQETFAPFAAAMAADGLAFLHTQMQVGRCGPVLAVAVEDRIVGAIGSLEVRPDAIGRPQLMPQYFAVLPEARGQGLGRVLWRAAMHWGQSYGASYQLLQTEVGGPSDRLCQIEGLTSLGFSHTTQAQRAPRPLVTGGHCSDNN
ncbi:GNAT family N-acetyltransferase [Streptomyces sp. RY43-2]|uniref:GNAT family N-acetyltransferase n=1 Tax=Streptomyces macrolidinus TaxID=2952607 RepID=A0ABT0ZEE9_9ACTN|nr:GNAT family N-acetyltransferase [Streptomyces macrolidinus]MCN9241959.1 GNAT family N-acetyltransferase [Streptomyces macrolidinus]